MIRQELLRMLTSRSGCVRALSHARLMGVLVCLTVGLTLLIGSAGARGQAAGADAVERDSERQRERESTQDGDFAVERDFEREHEREDAARTEDANRGEMERSIEPDQVLALDLSREAWIRARALGFRILEDEVLPGLAMRVTELSTPGGMPPTAALRQLRDADPTGIYDVNPRYAAAGEPACSGIRCDGQKLVAWPPHGCPQPVRLGMLDTAVAESSPALAGSQLQQRHFGETRASLGDAEHGTAVATLISGQEGAGFSGLLPHARLFAADVFNYAKGEPRASNAVMIARGLEWLLGQDLAAINVSLAGPDNAVVHAAVRRLTELGVPLIAAAGNLGPEGPPRYPAAYAEVIAVTAVDLQGQPYLQANRGAYIDVAAPGVNIWSAGAEGHGKFFDGTSFAAPFVAAEVALRRSLEPHLTPAEFKAAFHRTVTASGEQSAPTPAVALLKSAGCARASGSTVQ